ncbi:putative receptor-like protein kinase [Hibiscus syriacus]|uniref:non-specific serine/threonine protein kinase n=1 Tax=Hibiscus syriacus TaxID=106335 RepID=A0A6A2XB80_HIBSY|nr:putative receptor-like protein kinase [Hibiscus syriacus]
MSSRDALNAELSEKTPFLGLKLWVLIGLSVGAFILLILGILSVWVTFRRRRRPLDKFLLSQIPNVSKDIKVDKVGVERCNDHPENQVSSVHDKTSDKNAEKILHSGEEGSSGTVRDQSALLYGGLVTASPLVALPEISHLGWGHWFTLRDLDCATNHFSGENVIGEGGYGMVYKGILINGTEVAVKKLFNNLGQAEKEFRVEVEAIGHVRHKNLVRLLGYCIEGVHRMLVYEYVNNGNLEQWLHGEIWKHGTLTWEARMNVILGTAKALAYLHEAVEPKVVHRDIKSSNILIDDEFNAKVSDFGLAKLLDSGESHIATRVMGTFGYVAPEYANTGLLNERSDTYSFGVLLLEVVTGRDPVDYERPANEINLVEWLKMMVGARRAEEVVDPNLKPRPTTRALRRALLVALRCVDPDADKRPKMSQVVQMLDADDYPFREDRRNRKSHTSSMEIDSMKESPRNITETTRE